ncbi:MAG: lytic transglycosylase [Geobacteraceae bacterium GWC2_58_44]|nr:MAG: lytic transglycosylase [Geobacteraceae bacterium GWC2_58_44]HBG04392.1 lytic transglycosylase [Geobacter sp.]
MTKTILLILALLGPCAALAAYPAGSSAAESDRPQPLQQAAGGLLRFASARPDAGLTKALELAPSDFLDVEEQAEQPDGSFELKLPEEELPESDIPLTFNSKVEYFTRYFQNSGRSSFAKWLSRSERYIPMMRTVLRNEGLPEDLVYLAMIESGFAPHAFSVASAVGPWQFMSATGKRYDLRIDPWIDERRDPLKSTVAAALYLKELYAMFNNDWYLAAAGYNAGENKILRAINMYNSRDFWELTKGEYLKRETKDYVPKLLAAAIIAKEPAKYGFADVAYLPPIEFDVVRIPSRTDLELVARICGVSTHEIRELNPELRRSCTPPNYPGYELKIPRGMSALFEAGYARIAETERYTERVRNAQYRAKRKDTLASIARRFKTTPQTIAELNNLGRNARNLRGRLLTVPVQVAAAESEEPAPKSVRAEPRPQPGVAEFNKYYTVKKGDTLSSLARRFNVTARVLSAWNNLKTKVALKPGKRIIVAKYQGRRGALVKQSG